MRVPTTREAQGVADLIETNNVNRFIARSRQATRRRGAGKVGEPTGTSPSAARRILAGPSPHTTNPGAVRAAVSGPAPSYFGFAVSLLILTAAAGAMGVVVVIWAVDSLIRRVAVSD